MNVSNLLKPEATGLVQYITGVVTSTTVNLGQSNVTSLQGGMTFSFIPDSDGAKTIQVNNSLPAKNVVGNIANSKYGYTVIYNATVDSFMVVNKVKAVFGQQLAHSAHYYEFRDELEAIVDYNRNNSPSYFEEPIQTIDYLDGGGTGLYSDSTLMMNGKVLLTPYNATKIAIFDPDTNTITETSHSLTGYGSSGLLHDGRVLLVPYNGATKHLQYYNPADGSLTESNIPFLAPTAMAQPFVFDDGKVLLMNMGGGAAYLYLIDPDTDEMLDDVYDPYLFQGVNGTTHGHNALAYNIDDFIHGHKWDGDGSSKIISKFYNRVTQQYSIVFQNNEYTYIGVRGGRGAYVMLHDGRYFIWRGETHTDGSFNSCIYNPISRSKFYPGAWSTWSIPGGYYYYASGVLTPDGSVYFQSVGEADNAPALIYRPDTNTFSLTNTYYNAYPSVDPNTFRMRFLPNGKIMIVTPKNEGIKLLSNATVQQNFPLAFLCSRYMNV